MNELKVLIQDRMTRNGREAISETARIAYNDPISDSLVLFSLLLYFDYLFDMAFRGFFFYSQFLYSIYHSASTPTGNVKINLSDKIFVKGLYFSDRSFEIILQCSDVLI